jgi:hypothetical protein
MKVKINLDRVVNRLQAKIMRGLRAGAIALVNRTKQISSVAAPRKRTRVNGRWVYRATTPATPGAPPRKVSGDFRRSLTYMMVPGSLRVRVGTSIIYGGTLERQDHHHVKRAMKIFYHEIHDAVKNGMIAS